jgi:SAM-dependent methyltransferase
MDHQHAAQPHQHAAQPHQHAAQPHQHGADRAGPDADDFAELLDLDGEILHAYLSDLTGWVARRAAGTPARRILDLGAGTGTGTLALARRFGDAEVIAVDGSADLLGRLQARARDQGLDGRIRLVRADLDEGWPDTGDVDVAWASLSLHHLADPGRVLRDAFAAIRPGGLLAVAEMQDWPRFLPDDLGRGRPGLEARCHAALAVLRAGVMPDLGTDWGPRLEQAGFGPVERRTFTIDTDPPQPAAASRYAWLFLRRARPALADQLAADDLATLDALLAASGPDSLLHRTDLAVRGQRTAWIGRRP